jgi:hypothetical protein
MVSVSKMALKFVRLLHRVFRQVNGQGQDLEVLLLRRHHPIPMHLHHHLHPRPKHLEAGRE